MKRIGLRWKLLLWNSLLLTIVLVVLGMFGTLITLQVLVGRVDRHLDRQVEAVRRMYTEILRDPVQAPARRAAAEKVVSQIESSLHSLPGSGGGAGKGNWPIRVLDTNGKAFLRAYARIQGVDEPWNEGTFKEALQGQSSRIEFAFGDDNQMRLRTEPITIDGKVLAVIQGAESSKEAYEVTREELRILFGLIPVAVLIGLGCSWLVVYEAFKPAKTLAEKVAKIDANHLHTRLPVERKDEFGQISEGFNEMLERLEKAFTLVAEAKEQQQRFSADISHEFRNPLTVVTTNVSFALNDENLPLECRRALESTLSASRSMARLVEDLLLIARTESAPAAKPKTVIELTSILSQLQEQMSGENQPRIEMEDQPEVYAYGDPDYVERVFRNLIENAQNHTPPDGRIRIAVEPGDVAKVTIEDTGSGISPENLPRVRERFFRVDPARSRSKGGTGLGLTICDSLLYTCGGKLELESEPGQGTRATVFLPAFHLEEDRKAAAL